MQAIHMEGGKAEWEMQLKVPQNWLPRSAFARLSSTYYDPKLFSQHFKYSWPL